MRRVICALVVLATPAAAFAGDFDALRGTQVGYATYQRWSGFYGGVQFGEEFDGANFTNIGSAELTTITTFSSIFDGVPITSFPRLGALNTEKQSWSAFAGYNYQFEAAVLGVELNFTKTSFNAGINDVESHSYFKDINNVTYDVNYAVTTGASAKVNDYASIRGRAGWAYGNFLPYAFAGILVAQINATKFVNVTVCGEETPFDCNNPPPPSNPPPPARVGGTWTMADTVTGKWYIGYTAGLGMDYALTQNIFLRGELGYVQYEAPFNIRLNSTSARIGAGLKF
jgi:outer membrane immunogenic protein